MLSSTDISLNYLNTVSVLADMPKANLVCINGNIK